LVLGVSVRRIGNLPSKCQTSAYERPEEGFVSIVLSWMGEAPLPRTGGAPDALLGGSIGDGGGRVNEGAALLVNCRRNHTAAEAGFAEITEIEIPNAAIYLERRIGDRNYPRGRAAPCWPRFRRYRNSLLRL